MSKLTLSKLLIFTLLPTCVFSSRYPHLAATPLDGKEEVTVIKLKSAVIFAEATYSSITLSPYCGCVAFGRAALDNFDINSTKKEKEQTPLICPLLEEGASVSVCSDRVKYELKYEEFKNNSKIYKALSQDLRTAVGTSKKNLELSGVLITWKPIRRAVGSCSTDCAEPSISKFKFQFQVALVTLSGILGEKQVLETYTLLNYDGSKNLEESSVGKAKGNQASGIASFMIDQSKRLHNIPLKISNAKFEPVKYVYDVTDTLQVFCPSIDQYYQIESQSGGNKHLSVTTITGCKRNYFHNRNATLPLQVTCTLVGGEYLWSPREALRDLCKREVLYDTSSASTLENPYINATGADLEIASFSALYLDINMNTILVKVLQGCIELSVKYYGDFAPLICPLEAKHSSKPVGTTDGFQFKYQTVTADSDPDLLSSISSDISVIGMKFKAGLQVIEISEAYIFTWIGATYDGAECSADDACDDLKRNTYQVVLAMDRGDNPKTFVIINYSSLQWSGIANPGASPSEFSFAGFKTQDQKGYAALPYSGTAEIGKLLNLGTLRGLNGRYIFDVSSLPNPVRLGCYAADAELPDYPQTLSINTAHVDIYGDNVVRIQGACLSSTDSLRCGFLRRTTAGDKWNTTTVLKLDDYTGVCLTPRTPTVDVGWTSVGLSLDEGKTFKYQSEIYFGTDLNGGPLSQLQFQSTDNSKFWLTADPSKLADVTFLWDLNAFGAIDETDFPVDLSIVGYNFRVQAVEFPKFETVEVSKTSLKFDTVPQCEGPDCSDTLIGQFSIRVQPAEVLNVLERPEISRTSLSTALMPIGWFMHKFQSEKFATSLWPLKYCVQSKALRSNLQCPCTQTMAESEARLFYTMYDCDTDGENCLYSTEKLTCFTTLPIEGASVRCCYKESRELVLSQQSPLIGSYTLEVGADSNYQVYNQTGSFAQLSYHLSHIQNYFTCCSAPAAQLGEIPDQCFSFGYKRSAPNSCAAYVQSTWTAVIGDPHFITSDGTKYTFNGVGEYWFVYSPIANFQAKVQVRFRQVFDQSRKFANATVLNAISMEWQNSRIEIHMQPQILRQVERKLLMVLIDGKERQWEDFSDQFVGNFRVEAKSTQFDVLIRSKNDGPLINCHYINLNETNHDGGMNCEVSLPGSFKKLVFGLAGFWDDNSTNDLVPREDATRQQFRLIDHTNLQQVHDFGLTWLVREDESIFTYFRYSWRDYNREALSFLPLFEMPPVVDGSLEPPEVCASEDAEYYNECVYDLAITLNQDFAYATYLKLDEVFSVKKTISSIKELKCAFLDIPYTTFDFSNGQNIESVATLKGCMAGYKPAYDVENIIQYKCTKVNGDDTEWQPAPQPLCRNNDSIIGRSEKANLINTDLSGVFHINVRPTPAVGIPSFGGRMVSGFTVYPSKGCVALVGDLENSIFDDQSSLPLGNKNDAPLLCPLLATYAEDVESETTDYVNQFEVLYEEISQPDPELRLLTYDLQNILAAYDASSKSLEIVRAFAFTWLNARNKPCVAAGDCALASRNTYEVVLAQASDSHTYAVFNYRSINWSGTQTSADETAASVAALNYGKHKGTEPLPFSGLSTEYLAFLTTSGTYREVPGRFIYRVTDRFERLGCLALPDSYLQPQPITLNTYSADVFARRRLVLQAACVPENVSQWLCAFRRSDNDEQAWTAQSQVYRLDQYSVVCESPRLFDADVGEWTLGLSLDAGSTWKYTQDFYLEGANSASPGVELVDSHLWYAADVTQPLRIKWSEELLFADVHVYLIAYKQAFDGSIIRSEDRNLGLAVSANGSFEFNVDDVKCTADCEGLLVGQVALRHVDSSQWITGKVQYAEVLSALVPIGWFVHSYEVENSGHQWYLKYCNASRVGAPLQCPCSLEVAKLDYRAFVPVVNCRSSLGTECLLPIEANKCFTTLSLDSSGAALLCCYDESNNLIDSTNNPFNGSFELLHSPIASKADTFSYLSYQFSHTKNVFACCSADASQKTSQTCRDFAYSRSAAKSCQNYSTSGLSLVVGDPHFITVDNAVYTFNAIGEFSWLHHTESGFEVQVRLQNYENGYSAAGIFNASLLTAIVLRNEFSAFQVEVTDHDASSKEKLELYVNGKGKTLGSDSAERIYAGALVRYSAATSSLQIKLPDNGVTLQCSFQELQESSSAGSMACTLLLPPVFKGKILGLIGNWDGQKDNDLISKAKLDLTETTSPDNMQAVHQFGLTWNVAQNVSGFKYHGTDYEEVHGETFLFEPDYTMRVEKRKKAASDVEFACTSNDFQSRCEYDFRMTKSRLLASSTSLLMEEASTLKQSMTVENSAFCDVLDEPFSEISYSNGVRLNSTVTVTKCLDEYKPSAPLPVVLTCLYTGASLDWFPIVIRPICRVLSEVTTTAQSTALSTTNLVTLTSTERTTAQVTTLFSTQSSGATTIVNTSMSTLYSASTSIVPSTVTSASSTQQSSQFGSSTTTTTLRPLNATTAPGVPSTAASSVSTLDGSQSAGTTTSSRTSVVPLGSTPNSLFNTTTSLASSSFYPAQDNTLAIVLGTVAGVVALAAAGVCAYLFYFRPKYIKGKMKKVTPTEPPAMEMKATVIHVEPANTEAEQLPTYEETVDYEYIKA